MNLYLKANEFLQNIEKQLSKIGLDFQKYDIDHLCYRVSSREEYNYLKVFLSEQGDLLIESIVGGRPISTFKLLNPISYSNKNIFLIELPYPKSGSYYPTGFEHAEFIIDVEFNKFIALNPNLLFDCGSIDKDINPEIRLKLAQGKSVKFHHQSLEKVIEMEKEMVKL